MAYRKSAWVLGSLTAALTLLVYVATQAAPEKLAPVGSGELNFKGKFLVLSLQDESGGVLVDAEVRSIGSKYFLVGKGADVGDAFKAYAGKVIWLPVEHLLQIVEFDDFDDVKRLYEER